MLLSLTHLNNIQSQELVAASPEASIPIAFDNEEEQGYSNAGEAIGSPNSSHSSLPPSSPLHREGEIHAHSSSAPLLTSRRADYSRLVSGSPFPRIHYNPPASGFISTPRSPSPCTLDPKLAQVPTVPSRQASPASNPSSLVNQPQQPHATCSTTNPSQVSSVPGRYHFYGLANTYSDDDTAPGSNSDSRLTSQTSSTQGGGELHHLLETSSQGMENLRLQESQYQKPKMEEKTKQNFGIASESNSFEDELNHPVFEAFEASESHPAKELQQSQDSYANALEDSVYQNFEEDEGLGEGKESAREEREREGEAGLNA